MRVKPRTHLTNSDDCRWLTIIKHLKKKKSVMKLVVESVTDSSIEYLIYIAIVITQNGEGFLANAHEYRFPICIAEIYFFLANNVFFVERVELKKNSPNYL